MLYYSTFGIFSSLLFYFPWLLQDYTYLSVFMRLHFNLSINSVCHCTAFAYPLFSLLLLSILS